MSTAETIHHFDGALLFEGDAAYEDARRDAVWNGRKTSRRPRAILLATGESDVIAGVRFARAEGLQIGIRSGGHSWIANGIRDDVLLIDLSAMNAITLDVEAKTATVQPAAHGSDLNALLDAHGLVFPTGHCPSVGVGGFLLGGGYGWNSRAFGPACFSVHAIDVVLADGSFVHATDETHPDLMWAARGSGPGFFALVTKFYLNVHPAYDQVLVNSYLFTANARDEVLAWSYDILPETSAWLEMSVKVAEVDGHEGLMTRLVAVAFCSAAAGPEMLEIVENSAIVERAVERAERTVSSIQGLYDRSELFMPKGLRYAVDGVWTNAPAADIIAAGTEILDTVPTADSFLFWMLWGNVPERANACWSTQGQLYFSPNAVWSDPADDLRNETWAHHALKGFESVGIGTQFSDANPGDRPDRGMEPEQAARIEALRELYDPTHLFCSYLTPGESTTELGKFLALNA